MNGLRENDPKRSMLEQKAANGDLSKRSHLRKLSYMGMQLTSPLTQPTYVCHQDSSKHAQDA